MSQISASATSGSAGVTVKDAGVAVGTRSRLNFIEGANVTLTISDDAPNEEIDITIAASGGGGGAGNSYFPGGW